MGMIQIRNVPAPLHRRLKARAAEAGMSLSDYLRLEIERAANVPTTRELTDRLNALAPVDLGGEPAEVVRQLRDQP